MSDVFYLTFIYDIEIDINNDSNWTLTLHRILHTLKWLEVMKKQKDKKSQQTQDVELMLV